MTVWILFIAAILVFLALDLGIFNKTPHIIKSREAGIWTAIWVTLSFVFSGMIYWLYQNNYVNNPENYTPAIASMKFITGYLIELSLSVDNIFIIAVIFSSFKINLPNPFSKEFKAMVICPTGTPIFLSTVESVKSR